MQPHTKASSYNLNFTIYFCCLCLIFVAPLKHSSPLFKQTSILNLFDLAPSISTSSCLNLHNKLPPPVFDTYFPPISKINSYKHAFALPRVRTNDGIFDIHFSESKYGLHSSLPDIWGEGVKAILISSLISKD